MSELRTQRRLAAILAADVVGYSKLMGADEAGTLAALRVMWADRFHPHIARHQGRLVKMMGDGALVEFASAVDAVECAAAIQTAMLADQGTIALRIGINLGDIVIEGDDIFGDGVNIAARLEAQAPRYGLLVSEAVHAQVKGKISFAFTDVGDLVLKNIESPVRGWQWGGEGQPAIAEPPADAGYSIDSPSIAVLPFANMSGDPEQEYFSDGISEDIITDLSKIPGLMVIARNSSFAYKGKSPDIRAVGRDLGVGAVLEGSIRRAGNRVRITAQLIDAKTGGHLWAERYDRDLTDIFAVQDEVTLHIVGALRVTLAPQVLQQFQLRRSMNVEAHDTLLRSREMARQMLNSELSGKDVIDKLIAIQSHAIALDPAIGDAYAALAYTYLVEYQNNWSGIADPLALAARNAALAVEKDPASAFCWTALAVIRLNQRDLAGAKACAQTAMRQSPNFGTVYGTLGHIEIYLGDPLAALPYLDRAARLDPAFASQFIHFRGTAFLVARDYAKAAEAFRERIRLSPKTDLSRALLATALGHLGEADAARQIWHELQAINPAYSLEDHLGRLPFQNPADADNIRAGLTMAGLPG